MGNMTKLNFRLVPTKGIASGQGYRAEFVRDGDGVIDIDGVIAEAQRNGAFLNMQPGIVRSNLETFFGTMIDGVLKDGKTRKLDGYLELSLKLHGRFGANTDDYDPAKHSLDLSVKSLSGFAAHPTAIQPVNVNRIKQFRLSYITAASGMHRNHEVVCGQEFVIRGSNLTLPEVGFSGVYCQLETRTRTYYCAEAPIVSMTDSEIRCSWPVEYGPEAVGCRFWASVTKVTSPQGETPDVDRTIYAGVYAA